MEWDLVISKYTVLTLIYAFRIRHSRFGPNLGYLALGPVWTIVLTFGLGWDLNLGMFITLVGLGLNCSKAELGSNWSGQTSRVVLVVACLNK